MLALQSLFHSIQLLVEQTNGSALIYEYAKGTTTEHNASERALNT